MSGQLPGWRCCACGEFARSWAAAKRHVDEEHADDHGARLEWTWQETEE